MKTPGDAEQSTKRQRQEVTFREPQQTSSSSGAVADTSMQILAPQIPKPARPLFSGERKDSIPKRQRPAEVNTVMAIAGGDSSFEISALTDDQNALRTTKVNELPNVDNFGVVEVVDRPSQQVLSTRWVSKQRLDGSYKVRLVARGFEQTVSSDTDFHAGTPKITTLGALLTIAAIHGNPVAFGDCHNQSPMPSESEPVFVEPAPDAQLDYSKVWLSKKAFQGLKISLQACSIHSTQKINDMSYNQLISGPSTYVKKRAQRSDDSILLRHMDDVVGTGPDEHRMNDFEHMKTSLYLTDVVVLRHEGDTVNFLGLEITKTSKGFEVKNSTDLVESLLNLYGLETLENRQPILVWHLGDQTCNLPSNNYPHKSSIPQQKASAQ